MGRARDLAISSIRKRNEELESELKAQQVQVEKEKLEFKEKCTELETTIEILQEKGKFIQNTTQKTLHPTKINSKINFSCFSE